MSTTSQQLAQIRAACRSLNTPNFSYITTSIPYNIVIQGMTTNGYTLRSSKNETNHINETWTFLTKNGLTYSVVDYTVGTSSTITICKDYIVIEDYDDDI